MAPKSSNNASKKLSLSQAFNLTKRGREGDTSQVALQVNLNVDPIELPSELDDRKKRKDAYKCTFLSSWSISHTWGYSIIDSDGIERVKCTTCVEAKEKGRFAGIGAINIKKGALRDHENSDPH
ncbi:hypothetical protein GOP47_0026782 [Adiantum capillus-veneris]|nr:hypothetical protein GOP47_0026782 [Adiantum capillus-veneris]